MVCSSFACQDQSTNSLSSLEEELQTAQSWLPLRTLPLTQGNCPIQGYTLPLSVTRIQWLVDAGVQWMAWPSHRSLDYFEGPSHTRAPHGAGWHFCCDCIVAYLLLPKPASFTFSHVLFLRLLPNEFPAYKSLSQSLFSRKPDLRRLVPGATEKAKSKMGWEACPPAGWWQYKLHHWE